MLPRSNNLCVCVCINIRKVAPASGIIYHFSFLDDVITEQAILKWYNESHLQKGKSVFLMQMKPMVDWLLTAEEESDSGTIPTLDTKY